MFTNLNLFLSLKNVKMSLFNITSSFSSVLSNNTKVLALEKSLQQPFHDFKELLSDFEQLYIESDNNKTLFTEQKQRCESYSCSSSEALKKIIESKDNIIQLVASTLTRINETKDLKILDEVFKILFEGPPAPVPSYQDTINCKDSKKISPVTVKKELHSSAEDLSFRDESVSEIESTPTGRTSPIIQTKKQKSSLITSTDFRDKKKCPDTWPTPENKTLKLSFSTPKRGKQTGRLRQARLNVVRVKEADVIDITSSPEFSGGCRSSRSDNNSSNVQLIIKKESIEAEDTILPSPTSGPTNFIFKSKESPIKFKKPQLSLKIKSENNKTPKKLDQITNKAMIKQEQNSEIKLVSDIKNNNSVTFTQEDSINILNPKRLPNNLVKRSPVKNDRNTDETFCDTESSISLLRHVEQLEDIHQKDKECSPSKRPLAENINVTNVPEDDDLQPSMSLLKREPKVSKGAIENVKRKIPELVELAYKEPTVRKKAEKRLLPGWSCEKCIDFFGELYKDDPEMLAKKINKCSHHRGVHNPTDRPKTPPGYWNPRWKVPEDTDEFNRQNNVA